MDLRNNKATTSSLQDMACRQYDKCQETLVQINELEQYYHFHHEVGHCSRGLHALSNRSVRVAIDTGRETESVVQLIQQVKDLLKQLLDYETKISGLYENSMNIVPVHLRKLPVRSPIPVKALADYARNPAESVSEGEQLQLVDNSDGAKWKVRNGRDVEAVLPALLFLIPPPDGNAISHADRLRQQLMTTWQDLLHCIKTEARSVLGNYIKTRDSKNVSCLKAAQRDDIVSCLNNMLRILEPDSLSSVSGAMTFQKAVSQTKDAIEKLPPDVIDRRSAASRLLQEWQTNEKLLRHIEEFESFISAYRDSVLSTRQTAERVMNSNGPHSLKYVSKAYIERWPAASSRQASKDGSQNYDHLIISELGPTQMERYISRLEGELEEYMTETVTECTETDGEITTQTIKETQTFVIRGVVDPRTGEQVSIYQAIADRIISHNQGLYRNPDTGESMPIPAAMNAGLIVVERSNKVVEMGELIKSGIIRTTTTRETVTYSVLSIRDPASGDRIGVAEAIRRGIIDQTAGRYVINPRTKESISIPTAIDKGFLEVEVLSKMVRPRSAGNDATGSTNGGADEANERDGGSRVHLPAADFDDDEAGLLVTAVYDPVTRQRVTLEQAVERGLVDLRSGTFLTDPATGQTCPLANAVLNGYLSVQLADRSTDNAKNIIKRSVLALRSGPEVDHSANDVTDSKVAEPDVEEVDVNHNVFSRLKDSLDVDRDGIIDPVTGKRLTIGEALSSGLLCLDPLGMRAKDGSFMSLFDAAKCGLIDIDMFKGLLLALEPLSLEQLIDNSQLDIDSGQYIDPQSGNAVPLSAAIDSRLLDPHHVFYTDNTEGRNIVSLGHAISEGKWDPVSGTVVDVLTDRKLTPADAIIEGLIDPAIGIEQMLDQISILRVLHKSFDPASISGIKHSNGQSISVEQAIRDGVLDLSSGEYVNTESGERMSLAEAVERNLIDHQTAERILTGLCQSSLENSGFDLTTGEFVDPLTGERMSIQKAIDSGQLNPSSVFLTDPSTGQLASLSMLIREGTFDPSSGAIRDPSTGSAVLLADAVRSGTVTAGISLDDFIPPEKVDVQDLISNGKKSELESTPAVTLALPDGSKLTIKEAVAAGLLTPGMAVRVDRKTGNIQLEDETHERLVGALLSAKSCQDWLGGVEKSIADQHLTKIDDAVLIGQEIDLFKSLKADVDGHKKPVSKAVVEAQKAVDNVKQSRDPSTLQLAQKLRCNTSDLQIGYERVNGEVGKRIKKLNTITKDLEAYEQKFDEFQSSLLESQQEIDDYRKCVADAEDYNAVRNSFQRINDQILMKDGKLQELKVAGKKLIDDKQGYEKDEENFRSEISGALPSSGTNGVETARSPISSSKVEEMMRQAEDEFHKVLDESAHLLSKLDDVAAISTKYDGLSTELGRAIPETETMIKRAGDANSKQNAKGGGSKLDTEDNIQRRLEEVGHSAARVAGLNKTVSELQKTGDDLIRCLGDLGFDDDDLPKANEIATNVQSSKERVANLQSLVAEQQRVINASYAQLQDPEHNLEMLMTWISQVEDDLDRADKVSVDAEVLAEQTQSHQALTAELDSRRPRVEAVADACRETNGHRADELLDRFDAVLAKSEERGQTLEGIVSRMTDLQSGIRQIDGWLGATMNSVKHERLADRDTESLKARTEALYRQKQSRMSDMDRVKNMARELIDDPMTTDEHKLRETLANVHGRWNELTERLVQMMSYTALMEIDDLLKYLDRAENDISSADAVSIDPETLAVQLSQHKTFHEDLSARRSAVGDTIDRCNRLLRETTNDDADDIQSKLASIRDQADLVHRMSTDRLRSLEDALPVAQHLVATMADLRAWLDEIDAEIRSIDVLSDTSSEQVKKQIDNAKATLRIIEDHHPLVEDLVSTGQELTDMCAAEDAQTVRDDVTRITDKYNNVKHAVRDKLQQLNGTLRASGSDVADCLDGLIDELCYIRDQCNNADSIAASPCDIQDQIADNQVIGEDIKRGSVALSKLKDTVQRMLQQENGENPPAERAELIQKLQEAEVAEKSAFDAMLDRSSKLEEALFMAESFQQQFTDVLQSLQNVQDALLSQEAPSIDPTVVQEQLRELEGIKADMSSIQPSVTECRSLGEQMSSVCGSAGVVAIQKCLDDLNLAIEEINDNIEKRDADLNKAMNQSVNCIGSLQDIMQWLPKAEDRIQKMVPPAAELRAVRIQMEELKVFKVMVHGHCADIQNLNHLVAVLKNTSPASADSLLPEVEDVNQRWNQLLAGIADREKLLKNQLINLGDVERAVDDTIGMLQQCEADLNQVDDSCCDPNYIEKQIKKVQLLQKDLASQEAIIQRLNTAIQSLTVSNKDGSSNAALLEKKREMNEGYNVVQVLARDCLLQLRDKLRDAKDVFSHMDDLTRWLKDYQNELKSFGPLSALPDIVQQQLVKFTDRFRQLEDKEEEVKSALLAAEDLVGQSSEENTVDLREQMNGLTKQMLTIRLKADKLKLKFDEHLGSVQDFHSLLSSHGDWLNNAEKHFASFKYPSKLVGPVTKQIEEYKQFRREIESHDEMMQRLERAGTYLRYFGRKQDTVYIRTLLVSTKLRWKKLIRRVDERGRLLTQAYREDKRFDESWKSLCDWLTSSEQRLRLSPASSAKSKQDLDELQLEMTARQGDYSSTTRLGRNLKDRCTKVDSEREVLTGMLDQLKNKWNSLRSAVLQSQTKLDEALLTSGRFMDALQALMEWLEKAERYLTEDQPILGDLDTVNILIEQHKVFQQELAGRQTLVDAIRNSAANNPDTASQIDELNRAWESVNHLSNVRDSRLQDALGLAEEFHDAVQVVREWLPHAEAELKFRTISEDEEGILQLIENHDKFLKELHAQQPNIERITGLADEILTGCHPNAIRFVRYYLTITQTRWQQAVHRAEQRSARLQEALRMARGSAALVEELLTWLTEAHALLTAKEKDPLSNDLTVVETLLREHLEFHDDLTSKNREMEQLTSAPSGSRFRRNEFDAFSSRVAALQIKWRTVWRLSVERKKLIQDSLDHLLELESFKNFDFDEWRQRYINWIRDKKLRVTDFFRRQDKNGEGTLVRQQFVEGMMAAKFPTTRTELNAVFDIFDKHRTGEINYYEFMEALRPERQHAKRIVGRAATDAELIHDEVENQLSQCMCRRQFTSVKFGEGKYKFGDKGKLCMVRYLNSTVMVRVGGGWITLASFLESNDPCRAKVRLTSDARMSQESIRRPSMPSSPDLATDHAAQLPALSNRLSGSVSSLSSVGKLSSRSSCDSLPVGLASKRQSQLAKSCTNLSSPATPPTGKPPPSVVTTSSVPRRGSSQTTSQPRRSRELAAKSAAVAAQSSTNLRQQQQQQSPASSSTPGARRTVRISSLTPSVQNGSNGSAGRPKVNGTSLTSAASNTNVAAAASAGVQNGNSNSRSASSSATGPSATGRRTPTGSGSRSGSPTSSSSSKDRSRLTSVRQSMNF